MMPRMTNIIERYQTEQPVLSFRKTPTEKDVQSEFKKCYDEIRRYLLQYDEILTDVPFIIYYDYLFVDPHKIDLEICFPVARLIPPKENIISRVIPAGRIIFSMYNGPYYEISELYGKMTHWILQKGYEPAGYSYEYYFDGPDSPETDLLIKVVIPYT